MRDHITWTALAPFVLTLAPLRASAEYDISLQRRMGMNRIRDGWLQQQQTERQFAML